jgi:acylphosphatase
MNSGQIAYRAVVRGRVQGVGFRYTAASKASQFGLKGWVRNCPDGTVETHFEGDSLKTDKFLSWLHKGPPGAQVIGIDKHSIPPHGTYRAFSIEY